MLYPAGYAQRVNLSDSLNQVLHGPVTGIFKLDTRNSFVSGRGAQVWGIKAGISFRKRLNLGWHFSWLHSRILQSTTFQDHTTDARIRMYNTGPFAEYIFYRHGLWEATIPVQFGYGKSYAVITLPEERIHYNKGTVLMYEPAMIIEYKFGGVLALGGGIGYRLMLRENRDLAERFTAPYYLIRVRLITDEVLRLLRNQFDSHS